MEAVLHIEPIIRKTEYPISIGHQDYLFFGEKLTDDGENLGHAASRIRLGSPLQSLDVGSTLSHIPLVKSFEYGPDFSKDKGHVYSETIHYLKDNSQLIPFRTKLRSGLGRGMRVTHIPGLNAIRHHITGVQHSVCDPRADIVTDLLSNDQGFCRRKNQPLCDWITDELTPVLSNIPANNISFDTDSISQLINRYVRQLGHTSSDFSTQDLTSIASIISPDFTVVPTQYRSSSPICVPVTEFKTRLVTNQLDLRSFGRLNVERFSSVDYNPFSFQDVFDVIDHIPLTDFNIDIVVGTDFSLQMYHENVSIDRLGVMEDVESGLYSGTTILKEYLDESFLKKIIEKFVHFHPCVSEQIEEIICTNPVKLKIIKTITDEALILLYRWNSRADEEPMCGVYFDIALQSLAPMSIIDAVMSN